MPGKRKLEALLGLSEVAPDTEHLQVIFGVTLALFQRHNVINLRLPPISANSPTMPALPVVSN